MLKKDQRKAQKENDLNDDTAILSRNAIYLRGMADEKLRCVETKAAQYNIYVYIYIYINDK